MSTARLRWTLPAAPVRVVVLMLHGGWIRSSVRIGAWYPPVEQNRRLARHLARTLGPRGVAVVELRNRLRGWNAPELPAVQDARSAVAEVRRRWPDLPLVLLGCSMGARVAARLAAEVDAHGVVAMTPWWPAPEAGPVGTPTVVVSGTGDVLTPVRRSRRVVRALRAAGTPVRHVEVVAGGHLMLLRRRTWYRVAADAVELVGRPDPDAGGPAWVDVTVRLGGRVVGESGPSR